MNDLPSQAILRNFSCKIETKVYTFVREEG